MEPLDTARKSATLSPCGRYRYRLERWWGSGLPLVFVMLNPSTADADRDDQTIRKCCGFARRNGADGIVVVNLFAFRATRPLDLCVAMDDHDLPFIVGPENESQVEAVLQQYGRTGPICAWGTRVPVPPADVPLIRRLAQERNLRTLGVTVAGWPRHPLMLPYAKPPRPYAIETCTTYASAPIQEGQK